LETQSVIPVKGFLNHKTGKTLFNRVREQCKTKVSGIVLDLGALEGMDNLGGAWILRIKDYVVKQGAKFEHTGAKDSVEHYLALIAPGFNTLSVAPPKAPGFFESLGGGVFEAAKEAQQIITLLTDALYWTFLAPFEGRKIRWSNLLDELHEMGVRAIWIVLLINYLLGFIVAMLAAAQVRKFGAGIYVADLVSIGFARELAPIMTAIIISARSGAAITSEIATMKVQEELDALKVMGFHVGQFLIAPKIIAMLFAMPCLVLLGMGAGVWGGLHVGIFILGLDARQWMQETFSAVILGDLIQGLLKSIIFALIIVLVGCHNGLRVTGGARGVGLVTTRSVVMDIFFIIVFDVIFATLFYYTF